MKYLLIILFSYSILSAKEDFILFDERDTLEQSYLVILKNIDVGNSCHIGFGCYNDKDSKVYSIYFTMHQKVYVGDMTTEPHVYNHSIFFLANGERLRLEYDEEDGCTNIIHLPFSDTYKNKLNLINKLEKTGVVKIKIKCMPIDIDINLDRVTQKNFRERINQLLNIK